ncbi:MAG: CxxxxCH/CxxCH domain-containing protein [Nitrospirae bacterium]|nr:CxxxxCH/CxxCH domain-containing protein [Nitrospirota bacterium]
MGRIISNKVSSMNWMAKISLVLVFTMFIVFGVKFAYEAYAAGATGKHYVISADSGTTGNVSQYNVTVGTQFKIRLKVLDQATGAGITGLTNTAITLTSARVKLNGTVCTMTAGTDFTNGTFAAVGGGVYDWPITINTGGTCTKAAGDIADFTFRVVNAAAGTVDAQRVQATQYVKISTAGVAGDRRYVEIQPSTYGDITNAAAFNYPFDFRFIDATGVNFNPGTITWALTRYRDNAGTTPAGTWGVTCGAYGATTPGAYRCSLNVTGTTLTTNNRYYVYFSATNGNYISYQGFGLTAVAAQNNTPLTNPQFTSPSLFAVVDSTPPIVGTVNVTPISTTYTTSAPVITASLSDAESTVTGCEYTTNGGTWVAGVLTGSASPWTCTASPTGLTGSLTINIRGTSTGGVGTGTAVPLTVDVTAPTTTDDIVSTAWLLTEKTVTLTPNDGSGSGVTAATGIYGCFGVGCTPVVLGGNTMTSNCGVDNECVYDVRYYSKDNLNWTEATKTSVYQVWIDRKAPVGLAATTPADGAFDLPTSTTVNSTIATDAGSGFVDYYFEVDTDVGFSAPQTGGWQAGTSYAPTLAAGPTYFWRVKAKDTLGNIPAWTTPQSFSTLAACVRNDPTLTLETDTGAIQGFITTNGGTKDYILTVINNDYGGCGNTTFDLTVSDTDGGNNFEAPILSSLTATLAPGAQTTRIVTVTATAGKTTGQSLTNATYEGTDPNHLNVVNSNNVTTFINVVDCNANIPYLIIGPDSGNVAIGGNIEYTVTVQNTDTGSGCTSVIYNINIDSESNAPSTHFDASTLSLPSKTLNPGQKGSVTLTVTSKIGAVLDQINITTIGVTATGHTSPAAATATTTVGNRIIHNSVNTGSTRWSSSGGWGVPGGRYGEFDCMTCHTTSDATNIKKIRSSIVTPNPASGTLPGDSQPVVFTQISSSTGASGVFGDDSDTSPSGRTSSNRICEVCHTYDAAKVNGVNVHAYDQATYSGNNHQTANATDCIACHKHKVGFMPPDCGSCHGNPPGAGAPAGPLASSPFTTGSVTVGAHNTHYTTLGYTCNYCHNNQAMPQASLVYASQGDISISFSAFGSTSGTYSGQIGVSYNNVAGAGGLNCSSVYCHGATLDGTSTTAQWNGTVACGNCHKATAANPPTLGNHARHAGSSQVNLVCSDCHGANGAGGVGHVSGTVQWSLNTSNAQFGSNAKYNSAASGMINNLAPSSSYQTCTTLYCHSNVQGASGVGVPSSYKSPLWGAGTLGCAGCHVDMTTASGTSSHIKHANSGAGNYNLTCSNCHTGYTASATNSTLHANNTVNVTLASGTYSGGTTPGDHAPGGGYGSCSTNNCHSDGMATPSAYTNPAWGGAAACGTCHGVAAATPPASTPHTKHVGTAANYKYACYKCHANVAVAADSTASATLNGTYTTTHVNGTRNVDFDASSVGGSWAGSQCSNTYCHSQGTTFTVASATHAAIFWSGSKTCADCHTGGTSTGPSYTNNSPKANTHAQHVTTSGYVCVDCHSGTVTGSNTISDTSKHLNKAYDVAGASVTAYTYVSDGGTCTTKCHGSKTVKWGTQTTDATCVKCHGVVGTTSVQYASMTATAAPGFNGTGLDTNGDSLATDSQVGAHNAHLNSVSNYSSDIACNECHAVPASANASGHIDTALPAELTFGTLATTNVGSTTAPNYASPSCTNTYCHYGKSWGGYSPTTANAAVSWTNTAYLSGTPSLAGDCNMCHASPPSSHAGGMVIADCIGCHTHLNNDGTFLDPSLHINGAVNAAGGGCGGCHDYDNAGSVYASGVWTGGTWGKLPHRDDPTNQGWGAHAKHINHIKTRLAITYVLSTSNQTFGVGEPANVCGTCHTNTVGNHTTGGSTVRSINFGDGTYKYGGAAGFSFVLSGTNPTYNGVSATSSAVNPKTCSSVSCHFSTTPVWEAF